MPTITSLQSEVKRLPGRIINELGLHHLSPADKRAFAEDVWQKFDERIHELIWEGAANDEVMNVLQTEYEINSDLTPEEVLTILIENQPDLSEKISAELENIYSQFVQNN